MPVGSTVTYVVRALISASASGNLVNTASITPPSGVTDSNPNNNTATDTDTLAPADLSITNVGSPNPVVSGRQLTYTIKATNTGGQTATSVKVADPLPASAHFNSVSTTHGTCTGPATPKGGTVKCSVGSLGAGNSATITIVVTATTPGTLTNTASVTAPEITTPDSDDSATATTTVRGT